MTPPLPHCPDHFAALGLERSARLEETALRQAYFSAQRASHPDYATSPPQREAMERRSAEINDAYRTLRDPMQRLFHLLALQGHDVQSEDARAPACLLMESMEWRERWEEATTPQARADFLHWLEDDITQSWERCAHAIDAASWQAAVDLALRLRYLEKLRQDCTA